MSMSWPEQDQVHVSAEISTAAELASVDPLPSQQEPQCVQGLIPALPAGEFVNKPEEIDRFILQLWSDGTLRFKGPHARIEDFLRLCQEEGLDIQVDHISLCG